MQQLDHRESYGETICPYCGVGCRLWAEVGYGKVLRVKGDEPTVESSVAPLAVELPRADGFVYAGREEQVVEGQGYAVEIEG